MVRCDVASQVMLVAWSVSGLGVGVHLVGGPGGGGPPVGVCLGLVWAGVRVPLPCGCLVCPLV